jgi:hypothetical protein
VGVYSHIISYFNEIYGDIFVKKKDIRYILYAIRCIYLECACNKRRNYRDISPL